VRYPVINPAGVAELADARDLKSRGRKAVWVRSPPPAALIINNLLDQMVQRRKARNAFWPSCGLHWNGGQGKPRSS